MGIIHSRPKDKIMKFPEIHEYSNRASKSNFKYEEQLEYIKYGVLWKVKHKITGRYYILKELSKVLDRHFEQEKTQYNLIKMWANHIDSTKYNISNLLVNDRKHNIVWNEVIMQSSIRNPFSINLCFAFQEKSKIFMVYDYLPYGSLRQHLGKVKHFNEEQTRFIITCILNCLNYLNHINLMHGSINPDNIYFDVNGYAKLGGFGYAKYIENKPEIEERYVVQNLYIEDEYLSYYAPEYLLRKPMGKTVDYYALGIIAFEMMTGSAPLARKDRKEILELFKKSSVQVKKSDVPEDWSFEAADFINKLIQKYPENRLGFQEFDEILHHNWLNNISWTKVENQILEAPYDPRTHPQLAKIKFGKFKGSNNASSINQNSLQDNIDEKLEIECTRIFQDFYYSLNADLS